MSEKIKVDITNLDPKYWDGILAGENMPGENCPDNKNTNKINKRKITSCKECDPTKMYREGCCTGPIGRKIGEGSKPFKYDGINYDVCGALEYYEGEYICSVYYDRSDSCRFFECDTSLENRIGED